MFSKFLYHLKIFFFNIGEEWNRFNWKNKSKDSVTHIEVLPNFTFLFTHFGIITEILYARQHLVHRKKGFEYETLQLFSQQLKKGDVVLDIGANIGLFSLLGAKIVGNEGKVFAFEPSQQTFNALNKNIQLNNFQNITPVKIALSDTEGVIHLGDVENDAYNFIDVKAKNTALKTEQVPMLRLDDWVKSMNIKQVNFIKIDIEGAELLCFKGAAETLRLYRPIIIMECDERWCKRFDYKVYDVLTYLAQLGYEFENYDFSQWICTPKK